MSKYYTMICKCEDYKNGIKEIEGSLEWAFAHGREYKGGVFKYCPWCGKKLKRIDLDDDNNKGPIENLTEIL